ncbi:AraC family transcriptional regulator [Paenibacillus sp. GYB003]|uniref:AraC family transcriptional regulator n=1 Tax=Paenibacillus sp. GYB003 TaxID=2994392 RepID=UPI002F96CF1B
MTEKWIDAKRRLESLACEIASPDIAFAVHYWGVTPRHGDNPVHRHSFFEICYVVEGEGVYAEGAALHPLRAGTLFCSRPGVFHQIRSETGLYLLYVAFEAIEAKSRPDMLRKYEAWARQDRVVIQGGQRLPCVLLWQALLQLASEATMREAMTSAAHALLVSFMPAFLDDEGDEPRHPPYPNERYVKRATLFVRNNLSEPLPIRDVANQLHVSARHLSRLFKSVYGLSFSDYVRSERLRLAERLLAETGMPLKEIARETGFQSVHYFTRAFCRDKGIPPGKFREAKRKEDGSRSMSV